MEKTMGQKIHELREMNNMTLEQVGDLVGVGKSTVRKWETGMIANMRRDKIAKLAKALHTSPAYLMGWTDNPDASALTSETPSSKSFVESTNDRLLAYCRLIQYYNLLNDAGKAEATKRVEELTYIPIYTDTVSQTSDSDQDELLLMAAHERTDRETTDEDLQHDLNIMDDDSEWN